MTNFDLKKFLVENKLTTNAKRLSENENDNENDNEMFLDAVFETLNDQMRLNSITAKDFKAAKKYLEKHKIELSQEFMKGDPEGADVKGAADAIIKKVLDADPGPEYLQEYDIKKIKKNMTNFDLKKFLVENKLTTNSKTLNEAKPNKPGDPVYIVGEKEVNFDSIELGEQENSNEIYVYVIDSAMFTDGTTLDAEQLTDLENQYFEGQEEDKRIIPAGLRRQDEPVDIYETVKTGESIQYEFRTEEGFVKIGADNLPGYINSLLDKAGNKEVTLTFTSKVKTVTDSKPSTHFKDDLGRKRPL